MIIHLNDDWCFCSSIDSKEYETVRLPHSNVVMPFNCFDESLYQKVSKAQIDPSFLRMLKKFLLSQ